MTRNNFARHNKIKSKERKEKKQEFEKRVKMITENDRSAIKLLANCGHADRTTLLQMLGSDRIDNLARDGFLKLNTQRYKGKVHAAYCLGTLGEQYARNTMQITDSYNKQSVAHDSQIAREYIALSERERLSFKNESQVQDWAKRQLDSFEYDSKEISCVDAVYQTDEGRWVALEITTKHYKKHERIMKEAFSLAMGFEYREVRV